MSNMDFNIRRSRSDYQVRTHHNSNSDRNKTKSSSSEKSASKTNARVKLGNIGSTSSQTSLSVFCSSGHIDKKFDAIVVNATVINNAFTTAIIPSSLEQALQGLVHSAASALDMERTNALTPEQSGLILIEVASTFIEVVVRHWPDDVPERASHLSKEFQNIADHSKSQFGPIASRLASVLRSCEALLSLGEESADMAPPLARHINAAHHAFHKGDETTTTEAFNALGIVLLTDHSKSTQTTRYCADIINQIQQEGLPENHADIASSITSRLITLLAIEQMNGGPSRSPSPSPSPSLTNRTLKLEETLNQALYEYDLGNARQLRSLPEVEKRLMSVLDTFRDQANELNEDAYERLLGHINNIRQYVKDLACDPAAAPPTEDIGAVVKEFGAVWRQKEKRNEAHQYLREAKNITAAIGIAKERFHESISQGDSSAAKATLQALAGRLRARENYSELKMLLGRLLKASNTGAKPAVYARSWASIEKLATKAQQLFVEEFDPNASIPDNLARFGTKEQRDAYNALKTANPFALDKTLFIELTKIACAKKHHKIEFEHYFAAFFVVSKGKTFDSNDNSPLHEFVRKVDDRRGWPVKKENRGALAELAHKSCAHLYGENKPGYHGNERGLNIIKGICREVGASYASRIAWDYALSQALLAATPNPMNFALGAGGVSIAIGSFAGAYIAIKAARIRGSGSMLSDPHFPPLLKFAQFCAFATPIFAPILGAGVGHLTGAGPWAGAAAASKAVIYSQLVRATRQVFLTATHPYVRPTKLQHLDGTSLTAIEAVSVHTIRDLLYFVSTTILLGAVTPYNWGSFLPELKKTFVDNASGLAAAVGLASLPGAIVDGLDGLIPYAADIIYSKKTGRFEIVDDNAKARSLESFCEEAALRILAAAPGDLLSGLAAASRVPVARSPSITAPSSMAMNVSVTSTPSPSVIPPNDTAMNVSGTPEAANNQTSSVAYYAAAAPNFVSAALTGLDNPARSRWLKYVDERKKAIKNNTPFKGKPHHGLAEWACLKCCNFNRYELNAGLSALAARDKSIIIPGLDEGPSQRAQDISVEIEGNEISDTVSDDDGANEGEEKDSRVDFEIA